ncbi:MAG: hypothetical protein Q9168_002020 [Polycauliona sp. 1 TL-2023]
MRKPDLCFFQHVIRETGVHPSDIIMIDDTPENVCAARSQGMHAILVDKSLPSVGGVLHNLLQNPLRRAELFLKVNARNHNCVVEGHEEIGLKDNFAQLMIWELTDDEDIVYLKWPDGKLHEMNPGENSHLDGLSNGPLSGLSNGQPNSLSNGNPNGHSKGQPDGHSDRYLEELSDNSSNGSLNSNVFVPPNVEMGLWNCFFEAPVLTTAEFPADTDTTSTSYLSLPIRYLYRVTPVHLVLELMTANLDQDGIIQTYFDAKRPRTTPEVCINILRVFHKFGFGSDLRTKKTEDYIVDYLHNGTYMNGSRYYSTPESSLYFVARLYAETHSKLLRERLSAIKAQLQDRLNVPVDPLSLALRFFACRCVDMDPQVYRRDLETLMSSQDEDGDSQLAISAVWAGRVLA